jgi:hypothetical protein
MSPPNLLRGDSDMQAFADNKRSITMASHQAADRLTVTLAAPPSVSWDFAGQGRCPVTVSLDIYSNHPEASIMVSVEALEWIDLNTDTHASPNKSNASTPRARKRPPVKGLRWEGKSRFVDVIIPPLSSVSLPFLALIAKVGVFDIKR